MEIDDDLVAACKNKLLQFRIKELKDVLTQVGLSKQGKKQDLTDRILALLYDEGTPGLFKNNVNGKEGLVDIIDDAYRKMQELGGNDSNVKKQNSSGSGRTKPKEEAEASYQLERLIRCPCGSDEPSGGPLVQCVDSDCNVWQHSSCVIIPEKPMERIPTPSQFLCEICRLKRADPFWATLSHPLYPVKLASSANPVDGTNPRVTAERTFKLTRADKYLLQKADYHVQAWCMLFNDKVPFRMQWPQYADLEINGITIKTVGRPGSQLLGANGRDDGAKITLEIVEGVNKISLSGTDARNFCFGVRLVKRQTLEQVLGLIPKEPDGEPFENALARVHRCIGGGIMAGNDDNDSDLEVIADSITVNLRCPMSGSRMKTAGRFRACAHMGCFDLKTFVGLNERSRKWQCPICLKNYSLEDVIIDPFFNRILNMMRSCGEEINEIDMKPDGSWRVKNAREFGDLAQWHHPDGSIEVPPRSHTGQEYASECNTSKPGVQNNVVDCHLDGPLNDAVENIDQNIITMSSTTSGDGKDDEDPSINQNGAEQSGVSNMYEPEISSGLYKFGQTHQMNDQTCGLPSAHADVVILSDSEDDDVSLVYPETVPVASHTDHEGYSVYSPAKDPNSYPVVASDEGPGVFSTSAGDLLISQTPLPSNSPGGSGFDFFCTSGALVDEHNYATYSEPVNCLLTSESTKNPIPHVMDSYDPHNGNMSLEVLFPCPSISRNERPILNSSNGVESSTSSVQAHHESADENGLDSQTQFRSKEDALLQKMHDQSGSGSDHADGKRPASDGPFTFPRHRRSLRRRTNLHASNDLASKKSQL